MADPTANIPIVSAPRIADDSWLLDDRHEGARLFREVVYPYMLTQTRCIEALARISPEGAYFLWLAGKRAEGRWIATGENGGGSV